MKAYITVEVEVGDERGVTDTIDCLKQCRACLSHEVILVGAEEGFDMFSPRVTKVQCGHMVSHEVQK